MTAKKFTILWARDEVWSRREVTKMLSPRGIDQMTSDKRRWLFEPHANVEFGKVKVYSRFAQFFGSNIACAVIRLPLDLTVWLLVFYLGHRFGAYLFW
jgi:hypothetical protein